MNAIYKTYDANGNAVTFTSSKEMGDFLNLTRKERAAIFYPGVHTVGATEVLTVA